MITPEVLGKILNYKKALEGIDLTNVVKESSEFIDQDRQVKAREGIFVLGHPPEHLYCDACNKPIRDGLALGSNASIIQIYCQACAAEIIQIILQTAADADQVQVLLIGQAIAFLKTYYRGYAIRYNWDRGLGIWGEYADRCRLILFGIDEVAPFTHKASVLVNSLYAELAIHD